jgi:hypothetical protein
MHYDIDGVQRPIVEHYQPGRAIYQAVSCSANHARIACSTSHGCAT